MLAVSVSTFKKKEALRGWLESAKDFGAIGSINIADDNDGECEDVAREFQERHERGEYFAPVTYSTGPNLGIARNKNRGIKWFMESAEASPYQYLILSDDDIKFQRHSTTQDTICKTLGESFLKAHRDSGLHHITGYLGGHNAAPNDPDLMNTVFGAIREKGYRSIAEDDNLYHYPMSQGILLFFTRDILRRLGYYDTEWPSKYGCEHSLMSARANRIQGREQQLFPILKRCHYYLQCQGIPNNYVADPGPNFPVYQKRMEEVRNGIGLYRKNPGV